MKFVFNGFPEVLFIFQQMSEEGRFQVDEVILEQHKIVIQELKDLYISGSCIFVSSNV